MLIVLHGEDTFRSRQKLKEFKKSYLEKNKDGFSYEVFDATDLTFKEFKNALEVQSLFGGKRFVVMENLLKNKVLAEEIKDAEYKISTGDDNVVFYERESVARSSVYKDILKQATKAQDFKKLSPGKATTYFVKVFPKIERGIIQKVLTLCQQEFREGVNPDTMWQVYNELGKIQTYKDGKKISEKDLQTLNIGKQEAQIFPMIDAIYAGEADKAFYNLLLHFNEGAIPQQVFASIESQLKNIALVKEAKENGRVNPKELGLHPYVVKKTSDLTDKFSWQKIKTLYKRVESLDAKSKVGKVSPQLACELLSAAIVSS